MRGLVRCSICTGPGNCADTTSAIWRTDFDSVIWLNTRNSPRSAGFSTASRMHSTVSRMSIRPLIWLPVPYTVSGSPSTAWMTNRLSTVPNTLS